MKYQLNKFQKSFVTPLNLKGKEVYDKTFFQLHFFEEQKTYSTEFGFIENLTSGSLEEFEQILRGFTDLEKTLSTDCDHPGIRWGINFLRWQLEHNQIKGPTHCPIQQLLLEGMTPRQSSKMFKIKMGDDLQTNRQYLQSLMHNHPESLFRIDTNQRWDEQELNDFYHGLSSEEQSRLDYFEEPVKDTWRLLEQKSDIPLAVDESLEQALKQRSRWVSPPKALVVKPTLHDMQTIQTKAQGIPMVLSSTFESPYAHQYHLILADLLEKDFPHTSFHGLDTLEHFKENFPLPASLEVGSNYQKLKSFIPFY